MNSWSQTSYIPAVLSEDARALIIWHVCMRTLFLAALQVVNQAWFNGYSPPPFVRATPPPPTPTSTPLNLRGQPGSQMSNFLDGLGVPRNGRRRKLAEVWLHNWLNFLWWQVIHNFSNKLPKLWQSHLPYIAHVSWCQESKKQRCHSSLSHVVACSTYFKRLSWGLSSVMPLGKGS